MRLTKYLFEEIAKQRYKFLIKKVRKLRREQESYLVRLCEVMEQKKKEINDKDMNGEDKRLLTTRLE